MELCGSVIWLRFVEVPVLFELILFRTGYLEVMDRVEGSNIYRNLASPLYDGTLMDFEL